MRTQWEGNHLQARKMILTRTQPCWHPDLKLSASRTVGEWISVVEAIQSTVFCYGSLSWLIQLGITFIFLINISQVPTTVPGTQYDLSKNLANEWINRYGCQKLLRCSNSYLDKSPRIVSIGNFSFWELSPNLEIVLLGMGHTIQMRFTHSCGPGNKCWNSVLLSVKWG